ncbi:hypothetical protein QBC37DRAFT_397191 [Rhypophila decipiens]|uniref:Uncharacterized protein n=1 Tax=Rhypophila decipiens TaxID=261697 RepID=A0AAN7BAH4_9PEZI|nr:hypothetical protein QBC37DRAFT_397191 [Rhypophila decipiens]
MAARKRPAAESDNHEDLGASRPSKFQRTRKLNCVPGHAHAHEPGERERRPGTWQSLPVEIVLRIVASLAPGSYGLRDLPDKPLLGGFQHAPDWKEHTARRAALAAVCRVSKSLRDMALPLLYENVTLLHLANLSRLYQTLVRFPERGRYIKQLTFTLFDQQVTINQVPALFATTGNDFVAPRFKSGNQLTLYDRGLDHIRSKVMESLSSVTPERQDITCALVLQILALTPNISHLKLAAFSAWLAAYKRRDLPRDILLVFLLGTESASILEESREVLRKWFPPAIFGLDQQKFGKAPVFPPPSLKEVNFLHFRVNHSINMVTNRVSLFKPWACLELRRITQNWETVLDLQIPRDQEGYLRPSWMLKTMAASELGQFFFMRKYLAEIGRLNEDLFPNHRKIDSGDEGLDTRKCRNLDFALEMTETLEPTDLMIHSQDMSLDLQTFARMGQTTPPVCTQMERLRLHDHDTHLDAQATQFAARLDFAWDSPGSRTFQRIVQRHCHNLTVLDLALRLKKDMRRSTLLDFDPGQFQNIEVLRLPTEILWGPVRTVMEMLCVDEDDISGRKPLQVVVGLDGSPVLDANGNPIPLPNVWDRQTKAINRIPPNCKSICIRDWFAEYEPIIIDWNPLDLLRSVEGRTGHRRPGELRQEMETAVLNNTFLHNPEAVSFLNSTARSTRSFDKVVAHVHRHHQNETRFYYPSTKGDACWDPNPVCVAEEVDSFVERFIWALCSGLIAMCVPRKTGPTGDEEPGPDDDQATVFPTITQLRPNLKKISFVYTLHSQLEDRGDDWHAHNADLKWRTWYHGLKGGSPRDYCSPRDSSSSQDYSSSQDSGYLCLKKKIKEGSGIDFEVWEGDEGIVPKAPIWPAHITDEAVGHVTAGFSNLSLEDLEESGDPMDID